MAQKFSTFGSGLSNATNAAAVATQLGGGMATADVQALGAMLTAISNRNDLMIQLIALTGGPGGQTLANQVIPG